jgi:hypothetical protein
VKKKKWTLLYIVLNIFIITLIGILDPEIKDIGKLFHGVRFNWIMAGVASMVLFCITCLITTNSLLFSMVYFR